MASPEKFLHDRDKTVNVNFVCQRCCQPLKLHASFDDIDEQTLLDLTAPLFPNADDNGHSFVQGFQKNLDSNDISRKLILPVRFTETPNGFMVVGDALTGSTDNNNRGNTLQVSSALFDLMCDQSDIDHPLCEECTDNLLDQMDQQLKVAEDECKEYREFLEHLEEKEEEENIELLEAELEELRGKEEQLKSELFEVEEKEKVVKEVLRGCEEEQERLQREEDRYWQEYSCLKKQLLQCEDDQHSVDNQLRYAQAQLDKLKKTNVFNATFHIWHSGHFGTINNFRLGRLPSVPVDWPEINAAWGQTVLLLHSLAKKMDLTFERYRLVPYGNHSYLESLDDKSKELPLYFSGGFKFLWDTKFDQAMVGFLDCLQQFKEKVEDGDSSFHLPYKMDKGRIEDTRTGNTYSIKIQFNSEEQWTKALKFMLTNLKWGLAWVSSQFNSN